MGKPSFTVTIVEGLDCYWEADAIRKVLEGFGITVLKYLISRPVDFINFLQGNENPLNSDFIILCFHGGDGKFVMSELHPSIYKEIEPKGNVGPETIESYINLKDTNIINTGCCLGYEEMA